MEIKEVGINANAKRGKRINPKIIDASQKWLQEKGFDLEDLTEPQREAVFHLIKHKRGLLWGLFITFPCVFLCIIGIVFLTYALKRGNELFIPKQYPIENEVGGKVYQDVPAPLIEPIKRYGKICLLFGTFLAGGLYTFASGIGNSIGAFYGVKRKEKTITAFLPNCKGEA